MLVEREYEPQQYKSIQTEQLDLKNNPNCVFIELRLQYHNLHIISHKVCPLMDSKRTAG